MLRSQEFEATGELPEVTGELPGVTGEFAELTGYRRATRELQVGAQVLQVRVLVEAGGGKGVQEGGLGVWGIALRVLKMSM